MGAALPQEQSKSLGALRGEVAAPRAFLRSELGLLPSPTGAEPPSTLLPGLLPQPSPEALPGFTGARWKLELYQRQDKALP